MLFPALNCFREESQMIKAEIYTRLSQKTDVSNKLIKGDFAGVGQISPKFFLKFSDISVIGHFRQYGDRNYFLVKNEKRVSVQRTA